eukprot:TRINITY_DN3111_c4_g1_i1.p1 TRINITY_DN3111_c4_g1~~TRINITY_DN3111_c4_g1_i1.p1  ORF type:complete len:844 (+),score=241.99 TRINITY_DN3111_c4_g1_i1:64-2532(+)
MSLRLKDLVREVRGCKTAAEERAVIAKECAAIRTAFKEGKEAYRSRNVNKLVYIYLLGHATEFGQMECIRLMTSESFAEKKAGYLALSLLVDENHEVLTLVENQLKLDLSHRIEHVKTLALCAIANIAGEDMARDLGHEVATFLESNSSNLKKKACLAGLRIVRRVPSMAETFLDKLTNLSSEKNHGVLVAGLTLVTEGLQMEEGESFKAIYTKNIKSYIKILKNLVMPPYPSEYDVQGIADPFLQVKILQLLRVLGTGSKDTSDTMSDILAQVATNTESYTPVGPAILYECVRTIIAIESSPDLRGLAVTILGRFLTSSSSNNIRYVALNTLTRVVDKDSVAVQRHKNTIVDCLKDFDISIRKRALDLIYTLVSSQNIRLLVPDLINYLTFASPNLKGDLTEKICTTAERYAPSMQWHVDTLIKVCILAGAYVPETAVNKLISMVSKSTKEMQGYSTAKLWAEISKGPDTTLLSKEGLLLAALWCVGEFGDLLTAQKPPVVAEDIVTSVTSLLHSTNSPVVKGYALTCLAKTSARFPDIKLLVAPTMEVFQESLDLELQQRAWEYLQLINSDDPTIFKASLDRMPTIESESVVTSYAEEQQHVDPGTASPVVATANPVAVTAGPAAVSTAPQKKDDGGMSFLDDVFGGDGASTATAAPATAPVPAAGGFSIDDIFGGGGGAPVAVPPSQPAVPTFTPPHPLVGKVDVTMENRYFKVVIYSSRPNPIHPHKVLVSAVLANVSTTHITGVELLAAVTRTATLQMHPKEQDSVAPNALLVQNISVHNDANGNAGAKPICMKIRLVFVAGGAKESCEFTVSGIPS